MISMDFTSPWVQSLGWTFLHSLWQAPLIFLVMLSLLKCLPDRTAHLRHGMAVISLITVVITSVITFFWLHDTGAASLVAASEKSPSPALGITSGTSQGLSSPILNTLAWVDAHLDWMLQFWLAGFIVFLLRLSVGFWYIHRLRMYATPVEGFLFQRMNVLAEQLKINRVVNLAETHINSPQVIGYVKPVILFPVGLLAGLSVDQVEAILIHELAHIKRHDFLVSLFQSIAEAVFFFNPFVWMLSAAINQEREHCCDDMVLANGSAPLTYARTLAQLEEGRLAMPLALGLTGKRNQLLDRIKRIMEKTATKDSGRARVLPIVLIMLGLVFASWLSVDPDENQENVNLDQDKRVAVDTTKEKSKAESTTYERRRVTRWDESGEPHEEIEILERDHDQFNWRDDGEFEMPVVPEMPEFPDFPETPEATDFLLAPDFPEPLTSIPFIAPMNFYIDSIPDRQFHKLSDEEWVAFEKEFTTKFKEQFKDFYHKNGDQLEKLMDEARKKSDALQDSDWVRGFSNNMRMMEKELAMMEPRLHDFERSLPDIERMEMDMKRTQDDLLRHEKDMQRWERDMERHEREMKIWEEKSKQFEKELKEQLIKDGYLSKTETMDRLSFDDEGEITVNGKKVKESDKPKYREIHRKYFRDSSFHREE